jgi:hypothetical protein
MKFALFILSLASATVTGVLAVPVLTEYEELFNLCENGGSNSVRTVSNCPQVLI